MCESFKKKSKRVPGTTKNTSQTETKRHNYLQKQDGEKIRNTLNQVSINKVMAMLNSGMIPPGNSEIMHRLILGKARAGEAVLKSKNQDWDGICKQCSKVIKTMSHTLECAKTKEYCDNLCTYIGAPSKI